jgi:quinol monooxygenase YgiN
MEIKVQVPFQQLLTLVKSLTPGQKARLRQELAEEKPTIKDKEGFIEYLLNGPVYSDEEIHMIEENRKSIAAWRTKN